LGLFRLTPTATSVSSYSSADYFYHTRLDQPPVPASPYAEKIKAFVEYMQHERGLSPQTIRNRCWLIPRFLNRLGSADGSLAEITVTRIDEALREMVSQGSYARVTIQTWAGELRAFFRFAEARGWCRKGLAVAIQGPRIFAQASLPTGPSWDEVRSLLALTEGDRSADIRDRAILMLLAIYGLRAGEVNRLRLEDFDWQREVLSVTCPKTRRMRTYPLTRAVGDAVLRYLRKVRPRAIHREVFLTLLAPIRPLSGAIYGIVAKRLCTLNVSIPHHGPHALRHSCAARLLAQGFSLKEIGDHLGHQDPDTTRIYAKVDLVGLRQVADFDLGGLQ
jgi:integrase/recombinase XerD